MRAALRDLRQRWSSRGGTEFWRKLEAAHRISVLTYSVRRSALQLLGRKGRAVQQGNPAGAEAQEQRDALGIHEFHIGKVKLELPAFPKHFVAQFVQFRD